MNFAKFVFKEGVLNNAPLYLALAFFVKNSGTGFSAMSSLELFGLVLAVSIALSVLNWFLWGKEKAAKAAKAAKVDAKTASDADH
jgi:lipoprotein signal peptidase